MAVENDAQSDAWDLVDAGDDLARWVAEHCGIAGLLAAEELWRRNPVRSRNRRWKVKP